MEYNEIFSAVFEDGSKHIGGNLQYPGWGKCPEGFHSLVVKLPYGDGLVLAGYKLFNFYIGAIKELTGGKRTTISHIYALGSDGEQVVSYRITLVSAQGEKHKIGDITVRTFPFGKEGVGRTPTSGWKNGACL